MKLLMSLFGKRKQTKLQEPQPPQEEETLEQTENVCENTYPTEVDTKPQTIEELEKELELRNQQRIDAQEDLRNERLRNENLQEQVNTLKEQVNTLKERNKCKETEESAPKPTPTDATPTPTEPITEETPKQESSNEEVMTLLNTINDAINEQLASLMDKQRTMSLKLDKREEQYEQLMSRVQEDRYRKDKVKTLLSIIRTRSNIIDGLEYYHSEKMDGTDTQAAEFLVKQLEAVIVGIDANLRQEMIVKIEKGTPGSDFDEDQQEAVGTEITDNPELSGKVCRSVSPGFYWTLPYILKPRVNETGEEVRNYKFIISYEQVITYQYKKDEQ